MPSNVNSVFVSLQIPSDLTNATLLDYQRLMPDIEAAYQALTIPANSAIADLTNNSLILYSMNTTISLLSTGFNGIAQSANLSGTVNTSNRASATVTFTDATDTVNLTAHGLADGKGVRFTTTGTLPTGLSSADVYYVKSTDANTFTLYSNAALTTQVAFTTGSGTHTAIFNDVVVGASNAFTTNFIVGDVIYTSGSQGRTIKTIVSNTGLIVNTPFTNNESTATYKRGGLAPAATYFLYALSDGTSNYGWLSTRSEMDGQTLIDLPAGTLKRRQIRYNNTLNEPYLVYTNATNEISLAAGSYLQLAGATGVATNGSYCIRFANVDYALGRSITYASNAVTGDTFTINRTGVYHIDTTVLYGANIQVTITRNLAAAQTPINIIDSVPASAPKEERLAVLGTFMYDGCPTAVAVAQLNKNDVIRIHAHAVLASDLYTTLKIQRVS